MKIKKKKVIIAVCLVAVVGIGIFVKAKAGGNKPQGLMVNTTALTTRDIEESITLKAPLEGTESIDVVSNLHYEILKINVKEGDKVQKDQVLAVLDSKKLKEEIDAAKDSIELEKYKLNEKLSDAQEYYDIQKQKLDEKIAQSQISYDKALADFEEVKRQYDNTKQLVDAGAASVEELKKLETLILDAQNKLDVFTVSEGRVVPDASEIASLETASNGVSIINGKATANASDNKSIDILNTTLQRKMQDLQDCEIKSNIDGTITRVYGKVGRFADDIDSDKARPMFVVEDMEQLQMTVSVSEYDIAKIKEGQKVVIGAEILGKDTVEGIVARISPTGEEKQNSTGTVERVIPTQINVVQKNDKLIAGITASAKIEIAKSLGTFVAPNEAVLENADGQSQIYRVSAENKIEIIPVTLGLQSDLEIEVKSDKLKEGDNIVLNPDMTMTEGMDVMMAPAGGATQGM